MVRSISLPLSRFHPSLVVWPVRSFFASSNSFPTGTPLALGAYLTQHLPLLFPASESDPPFHDLGHPLVQGVPVPKDADMGWLGACMAGADGWVNVCIALLRDK